VRRARLRAPGPSRRQARMRQRSSEHGLQPPIWSGAQRCANAKLHEHAPPALASPGDRPPARDRRRDLPPVRIAASPQRADHVCTCVADRRPRRTLPRLPHTSIPAEQHCDRVRDAFRLRPRPCTGGTGGVLMSRPSGFSGSRRRAGGGGLTARGRRTRQQPGKRTGGAAESRSPRSRAHRAPLPRIPHPTGSRPSRPRRVHPTSCSC